MLTLTLFRHAKSSWDDEAIDDFERPLAPRGMEAAPRMGQELTTRGPAIECILCSPAKRARQTLDLALPVLPTPKPAVHFEDALYHGLPETLLKTLKAGSGEAQHVVLIGHNPGLELLATHLIGEGPADAIAALTAKYPTAGLVQIQFDVRSWDDLEIGSGKLIYFLTPRSLDP